MDDLQEELWPIVLADGKTILATFVLKLKTLQYRHNLR